MNGTHYEWSVERTAGWDFGEKYKVGGSSGMKEDEQIMLVVFHRETKVRREDALCKEGLNGSCKLQMKQFVQSVVQTRVKAAGLTCSEWPHSKLEMLRISLEIMVQTV